jgi:hypothetical protein
MAGPIKPEDEWFAKYEIQLIRDAKRKREQSAETKDKENNLPANYMQCPVDGTKMNAKKFKEIEINICPSCDGIWLDRGELEELIVAHEKDRKGFFRRLLGFE